MQAPSVSETAANKPAVPFALLGFVAILIANIVLNLAVGFVEIPLPQIHRATLVVSVLSVCLPIFALYKGAEANFAWIKWLGLAGLGVAIQAGLAFASVKEKHNPAISGLLFALSQSGLLVWCLGLGGLVASAIKDKNLLLPLAAFLGIFDFWLVFVPEGPVGQIARGDQKALSRMAYSVPQVAHVSHGGHASSLAYIGPADFVFLAMFFVALFRFRMRTRATFLAIMPVLACYLLFVLEASNVYIGPIKLSALPALIPIGATVLIVNRKQFDLTKDEKISSAIILTLGVVLVAWRLYVNFGHPPPVAPSQEIEGTQPGGQDATPDRPPTTPPGPSPKGSWPGTPGPPSSPPRPRPSVTSV